MAAVVPAGLTAPRRAAGRFYEAVDGVVVRAPLLPVQRYLAPGDPVHDPLVRLAVCVASDSLSAELARCDGSPDREDGRAAAAALRYLIRCSTRPTPYGMFAGIAVGGWGEATDVRIADGPRRVRTRPDMAWLTGVVLDLEELLRPHLGIVANTCAFEQDGRVHLSDRTAGGGADGPDVSIRATGVVRRLLADTRDGLPYQELVDRLLAATPGATVGQVRGLIDELCRHDLIATDLRPPMAGRPVEHVLARLAATPGAEPLADRLREIVEAAAAVDAAAMSPTADAAIAAVTGFRAHAAAVAAATADRARIVRGGPAPRRADRRPGTADVLQVDAALTLAAGTVSARVAADAALAADLLLRLHPAPGGPRHLAAYRTRFLHRYGPDRRVPLLQLLDPRFGLGPPESSRGHGHGGRRAAAHPPAPDTRDPRAVARRVDRLWELATRPTARDTAGRDDPHGGIGEVMLTDDDLAVLSLWDPDPRQLPASLELSVFVLAESAAAVDRGDHLLMVGPNLGAHEAGRGLGRFADLLGAPATGLLRGLADRERGLRAGVPAAELTYLPRNHRSANVTVRESLRELEIPVGVNPGVPPDRVVAPDELSVLVRGDRLRLWWERAGHEIVVTAGHMLNASAAPEVCRFLHEVGVDGVTVPTSFDWGPANALPVLPRVRRGRIVLRPARWRHSRDDAAAALRVADAAAFPGALGRWRERWRLPRRVYLSTGDNRLLLDLDDPDQAELLRLHLRGSGGTDLLLQEALPGPEHAWVDGPGGRYVSELVVPMVRRVPDRPPPDRAGPGLTPAAAPPEPEAPPVTRERLDAARIRPPGSDWLYVTLSGPAGGQDELVAGPVRELTARLPVTSWYFLRYADPERHLRLRLHGDPAVLREQVLPAVLAAGGDLVAAGRLHQVGLQTYERELERYGGPDAIELAEGVFATDSVAVAAALATAAVHGSRLPLAALSVDRLLAGLGFDDDRRLDWYSEHAPPPRESAAAHRQHGARVAQLLHGGPDPAGAPERTGREHIRHEHTGHGTDSSADDEVRALFAVRAAGLRPLGAELTAMAAAGTCTLPLAVLARSFVHMSCNRLGVDPAAERIVLGLLRRNAWSRRARSAAVEVVEPGADRPVVGGQ